MNSWKQAYNYQYYHLFRVTKERKFSQGSVQSCEKLGPPHDSVACRNTFSANNLKYFFFNDFICFSYHCGGIQTFYNTGNICLLSSISLGHWVLQAGFLKSQHSTKVWTLTFVFIFLSFCSRFAALF